MTKIEFYRNDFTGEVYASSKECRKSEMEFVGLRMYNEYGQTDLASHTTAVEFKNSNAAKYFISQCKIEDCSHDGITEESTGFFVWSHKEFQYFLVDPGVLKACKNIISD